MENLTKRCVLVLSNDNTLREKDIYDRLNKVKKGVVESVLPSGPGRWLVVFSADAGDVAYRLHRKGSFHIDIADVDRVREVTASVTPADLNTVHSVYSALKPTLVPKVAENKPVGGQSTSQNSDDDEKVAFETRARTSSERTASATSSKRLTVDYVMLRNPKKWNNESDSSSGNESGLQQAFEWQDGKNQASTSKKESSVGSYSSSYSECASENETSQRNSDNNGAAFGYLEFRYLASDTSFLNKLQELHGVKVEFKIDENAPQMEVEGQNAAAAMNDLHQMVMKLINVERKVNAAKAWLLSRSAVAADTLQQKLAQNGVAVSWYICEFQGSPASSVDELIQKGACHLLESSVTVTLCAQQESAFDMFCTQLDGLFQEEKRPLSEQTFTPHRWDNFLVELKAKLRNEFYAQADLPAHACTFLALPNKMRELLAAYSEVDVTSRTLVHFISADRVRLRYLQTFHETGLNRAADPGLGLNMLPDRLEIIGDKALVEKAREQLLKLIRSVLRETLSYQSLTLARLLKMPGVLQELETRNKCVVLLDSDLNSTTPTELLRYKTGQLTVVVRCADILDNETDVLASFTDVEMSESFGTVRPQLMKAAGSEVRAECSRQTLQLGQVALTKSGQLQNYSNIAHLCVYAKTASLEEVAVAHRRAVRLLLTMSASKHFTSVTFAVPREVVCSEVLTAIREFAIKSATKTEIHFVNPDFDVVDQFATLVCLAFDVRRSSDYPRELREARPRAKVLEEYRCPNGLCVTLCCGELCDIEADLVTTVSSTDADLLDTDDVSATLLRKAGRTTLDQLRTAFRDKVTTKGLAVAPVASLPHCRFVAHALLPQYANSRNVNNEKLLRSLVRNVLQAAATRQLNSVAFGPLGCGRLLYPASTVAETMLSILLKLDARRKVPSNLAVKIVLPKADRDLQATFSNAFYVRVKPTRSWKTREAQYFRIDSVNYEEVVCKANVGVLNILLICSPVLSNCASAEALLHPIGQAAGLGGDVSSALAAAANLTKAQLQDEIDKASSKFDIRFSAPPNKKIPFSCILHAKIDDTYSSNDTAVLDSVLKLCEDKELSSITLPVAKTNVDWTTLIGSIGKFAKQRPKRLGTVKLVASVDHTDSFCNATSQFTGQVQTKAAKKNFADSWNVQVCHAQMKISVFHTSKESVTAVQRDIDMLICSGAEFLKQQQASPPQTPTPRVLDEPEFLYRRTQPNRDRGHTIFENLKGHQSDSWINVRQKQLNFLRNFILALLSFIQNLRKFDLAFAPVFRLHRCQYSEKELEVIQSDRLTISKHVLGSGNFGQVRIGVFKENDFNQEVAVKLVERGDDDQANDLIKEATLMSKLSHPNIVRILGLATNENFVMIVMELVKLSSLLKYIKHAPNPIGEAKILHWVKQVAAGMAYLEKNSIIHRDLAARNILLDSESLCKISDFGLSHRLKNADDIYLMKRPAIPVRWYPPECLSEGDKVFVQKSDVWSYGVLMWETYSMGSVPYSDTFPRITVDNLNMFVSYLVRGKRLAQTANCCTESYAVMKQCWHIDAQKRPAFSEIVKMLDDVTNYASEASS